MMRSFALLAALLAAAAALGQTTAITPSPQESKVISREMLCGYQGLPPTSTEIPSIGCFRVPSGGSARGVFDGHQFVVGVDADSWAKCRLDDAAVDCAGCIGQRVLECPVMFMEVSHNPDKSVSFSVFRKADGDTYLYRIDAWNRYLEEKRTRDEVAAVEDQTPPPALPPGPPAAVPIPPRPAPSSPPVGVVPGAVEPMDGPVAQYSAGLRAQGAYGIGQFAELDQLIETLAQPDQLTDDGLPRLPGAAQGLRDFMSGRNNWQIDLDKIAEWHKEYPNSYAADLVEAIFWRAWAWHVRGSGYASTVTPEGWKLFGDKLAHADDVLGRCKSRASKSPLWYSLRLSVAREASWDRKRYQALFDEATQRFPWYVPFYLSAANYFSPKWGGTSEDVDKLARRTIASPLGSDYSLYTRIYWELTDEAPGDFDPFRDSKASWPLMKVGFESLMKRYPKSKWNLNAYAYFACRANDGSTYGALRARIGADLIQSAWASSYSIEVCDERLLSHT